MKLKVEVCDYNNLSKIWKTCSELAMNMSYPSFFCTGEWLSAAVINGPHKNNLLILIIKNDNNTIGLLPLEKKINWLGGRDLYYLGHDYYPDPVGLICSQSDRAECAEAIKKFLSNMSCWDRLIIDSVYEDELSDWHLSGRKISVSPFKTLPNDFSEILQEFTTRKRYNLRSHVKKLFKDGGLFLKATSVSENKEFLDNLFYLHDLRSIEVGRDSTFSGENIKSFHDKLISSSNNVKLFGIKYNDSFISMVYGFEFNKVYFFYMVAHNPKYNQFRAGSVLLYLVIEDCCMRGINEFNFLQGNETYKSIWTKDARELYRLTLSNRSWRACILSCVEFCLDCVKRCIRPLKALWANPS